MVAARLTERCRPGSFKARDEPSDANGVDAVGPIRVGGRRSGLTPGAIRDIGGHDGRDGGAGRRDRSRDCRGHHVARTTARHQVVKRIGALPHILRQSRADMSFGSFAISFSPSPLYPHQLGRKSPIPSGTQGRFRRPLPLPTTP